MRNATLLFLGRGLHRERQRGWWHLKLPAVPVPPVSCPDHFALAMRLSASSKASGPALGLYSPCCRAGFPPFQRSDPSCLRQPSSVKRHIRQQRCRRAGPAQALLLEEASTLGSGCLNSLQHAVATSVQLGSAMSDGLGSSGSGGSSAAAAALLALADLATALQPACFDADCERQKDMLLVARYATLSMAVQAPGSCLCL